MLKANRFLTITIFATSISVSYFIFYLAKHSNVFFKYIIFTFFLLYILTFSFLSFKQSTIWYDNYSLWSYTVQCAPKSSVAFNNLAITLFNKHDFDNSLIYFKKASILNPEDPSIFGNIGQCYALKNDFLNAEPYFKRSFALNSNDCLSMSRYLGVLMRNNKYCEAFDILNIFSKSTSCLKKDVYLTLNNNMKDKCIK